MESKYYELHEFDKAIDITEIEFSDKSRVALFMDKQEASTAKCESEKNNKEKSYMVLGIDEL